MPSLPDSGLSIRELDALFDQSPIPMVFGDRELRAPAHQRGVLPAGGPPGRGDPRPPALRS